MDLLFGSFGEDYGFLTIVMIFLFIFILFRMASIGVRLTRMEKRYKAFMKGSDAATLEKAFIKKLGQVDAQIEKNTNFDRQIESLRQGMNAIYSKYGVEKYDAFEDVGGKLSFALALLDKENNGLILNAVHSRDNCYLYLKEIVKGESFVMLSQEEVEALRKAVNYGLADIGNED